MTIMVNNYLKESMQRETRAWSIMTVSSPGPSAVPNRSMPSLSSQGEGSTTHKIDRNE